MGGSPYSHKGLDVTEATEHTQHGLVQPSHLQARKVAEGPGDL